MNITNEYAVMIFRNDYEGKTYYKVGLSKKDMNGGYINGYITIRFKKDVVLSDQTKIYIKHAWLDFYLKDKQTIPYIFCSAFELQSDAMQEGKKEIAVPNNITSNYEDSIILDDSDLPF